MAGKHSKGFLDFKKSPYALSPNGNLTELKHISLPLKIIIFTLVISITVSCVFVGNFFIQIQSNKKLLADAKSVFKSNNSSDSIKILAEKNQDIKGRLKISGVDIDCVVCQAEDDSFYLNHNYLGKKSRFGSLFLSASDTFERKGNDHNIVIFGNNMKDGSMFGSLKKYRNLNFYKRNPNFQLFYADQKETYTIFAVMLISSSGDDNGTVYKPSKSHFVDQNEFDKWFKETQSRSLINTTVNAEYGDDILTLVTVADDFDGARLVVMAKKSSEWDASHTDVSGATVNPEIKYPKIWYTARGLEYPH